MRSIGKLIAAFGWAIGTMAALLFTCFWTFGIFMTGRFRLLPLLISVSGGWLTWEGFKMFRSALNSR